MRIIKVNQNVNNKKVRRSLKVIRRKQTNGKEFD